MFTNCTTRFFIAWNEVDWSAIIVPDKRPTSCCGKKPFGTPSQARPCPRREPLPPGHPGPARRGTVERCAVSIHTTERLGEGSQPMGPPCATQASLLAD